MTSPPQQPEQLVPASQTSRVSPKTVDGAVNALLKWRSEKSKTEKAQLLDQDEFVYLIVTLKKIPQTSRTKPHRIPLPHPLIDTNEDSPELCLIIDDRPKSGLKKEDAKKKIQSENIPITKIIKLSKLKSDYRPFEAKRKLCDSYNMFFADKRVIPLLPRLIGKKFFESKKIPVAVDLKHKNWKEQIERACGSAMFFLRTGTCSVVKVGKLSMESDEIAENVMVTLNGVAEILPSNWKYVRSLHLKLSESLALPIYQTVPDLKLKIDGIETAKESGVKEGKKGKSSDVVAVDGSESSEKSVSVKAKKMKGRIHEVRYMDSNVSEVLDEDEIGGGDVEDTNEVVESPDQDKKKKRKKTEMGDVAVSEKPVKKASKAKKMESDVVTPKAAAKGKKMKLDSVTPKAKSKDELKAKKTKIVKQESGGGLKPKTTKSAKEESNGGLKPMRKKAVLRK